MLLLMPAIQHKNNDIENKLVTILG